MADPVTIGAGVMAGGQIIGGMMGNSANNKAIKAQQKRQRNIDAMGQNLMGRAGQDPGLGALYQFLGLGSGQGLMGQGATQYSTPTIDPAMANVDPITGQRINVPGLSGMGSFNTGQDAIMQLLRADPHRQMDAGLTSGLNQMATSQGFDNTALFKSLQPLEDRAVNQQVSQLRAGAGTLGQRFGGAMYGAEANARTSAAEQGAARREQIAQSSYNANQGNILQALGLMSGREQAGNQFALDARGQSAGLAQQLAQLGLALNQQDIGVQGQNADMNMRAQLANQQTGFQNQNAMNAARGQNASNQLATNQLNQGSQQAWINSIMQGLGLGMNQQNSQNNYLAQLFGIMSGQQSPGTTGQPNYGNMMGGLGSILMMLPQLRGLGKPGANINV